MGETSLLVFLVVLGVIIVVIRLGVADATKMKIKSDHGIIKTKEDSPKIIPEFIGMTRYEQIAENFLAGVYTGDNLFTAIQYILSNNYRFSAEQDLSGLKRIIKADGWTVAHELANSGYIFDQPVLKAIGNPGDTYGCTVADVMLSLGHPFSYSDLAELGNSGGQWGITMAHEMARGGVVFTVNELLELKNPADYKGQTVAHLMAQQGHKFSLDEIILLGNPANTFGVTLAHWMARWGHAYSVNEILQLGNPVIAYSQEDLLWDSNFNDKEHVFNEEFEYRNKSNVLHNGATIAHIMAREGHRFTAREIKALGNPVDAEGLTIADWKARAGNSMPKGALKGSE